jgi:hypothetical protein
MEIAISNSTHRDGTTRRKAIHRSRSGCGRDGPETCNVGAGPMFLCKQLARSGKIESATDCRLSRNSRNEKKQSKNQATYTPTQDKAAPLGRKMSQQAP